MRTSTRWFSHALVAVLTMVPLAALAQDGGRQATRERRTREAPRSGPLLLTSGDPRDVDPQVDPADADALVAGHTAFALDLYALLAQEGGNVVMSPHSINVVMAMVYAGARGDTETEMTDALHITLPQDKLHPAFNQLDLDLAQRSMLPVKGAPRLTQVNELFAHQAFPFLREFLEQLAANYGTGVQLLDFVRDHEQARRIINTWVASQTGDRIQDLFPLGTITENTRLVLTNALTFKAQWLLPFDDRRTAPGDFELLDGSPVTVQMMSVDTFFPYASSDGWQAVELPYVGEQLSMVVLAPDAGAFVSFEQALTPQVLTQVLDSLTEQRVHVFLPRFRIHFDAMLNEPLQELGMRKAFVFGEADFTGMSNLGRLMFVRAVMHQAFIEVDEYGTEAAAATGASIDFESARPRMQVDHPFLFLIRDRPTGTILFFGRVLNPLVE